LPSEKLRSFLQAYAGGSLGPDVVEEVRLFDIYTGANLEGNLRSLAFSIDYRHVERTLTDSEVNIAFHEVIEALKLEFNVEIR